MQFKVSRRHQLLLLTCAFSVAGSDLEASQGRFAVILTLLEILVSLITVHPCTSWHVSVPDAFGFSEYICLYNEAFQLVGRLLSASLYTEHNSSFDVVRWNHWYLPVKISNFKFFPL